MTVSLNATRASISALALTALLTLSPQAQAQSSHVAISPDGSGSYIGAVSEEVARRVAADVLDRLPDLEMRSKITFLPLGEFGTRNAVREVVISRRFPPQAARQAIADMIATFPAMVAGEGTQQATNILGTLDQIARRMDCSAREGHVFVLSDGQETLQNMSLLSTPIFEGCVSFTIIGVLGTSPAHTQELGAYWMRYCEAAGFQTCSWLS